MSSYSSSSSRKSKRSIWALRNVEWPLQNDAKPQLVEAANGWIIAMLESKLIRWNVRRGGGAETLATLETTPVEHLFVDPTASHIILSSSNGEAYHWAAQKFEKLTGFGDPNVVPGHPATAVAHRPDAPVQNGVSYGSYVTSVAWEGSSILLGTSLGEIYEYNSFEGKPTLLHKLDEIPITGLYWERLRTGMVVTVAVSAKHKPTRFYVFFSPHSSSLRMVLGDDKFSMMELPGSIDFATLSICDDSFALMTATGIYHGRIDRSLSVKTLTGSASLICESGILPYDKNIIPHSLVVTPHHFVAVTNDEVQFINKVAAKVIQRERIDFPSTEKVFLMKDVRRPDQVWLRQGRFLTHMSSGQEDRDVWKFTLQKALSDDKMQEELFEKAKRLCTNQAQKAVVTAARAEYHLANGKPELAAKYLAQCPPRLKPFADTSVRLALSNDNKDGSNLPLIEYLSDKMRLAKLNDDRMSGTMIGAWLTELFLHDRSEKMLDVEYREKSKAMLTQFLENYVNIMDAKTIIKILSSHDVSAAECAVYASTSGDVSTAVNAALALSSGEEGVLHALKVLNNAPFEQAEVLYYKHAATLLMRAPGAAVESFLTRYQDGLSPARLLPSIMHYEKMRVAKQRLQSTGKEGPFKEPSLSIVKVPGRDAKENPVDAEDQSQSVAKYLAGVVKKGCRNSAIFSYLIHLYAQLPDEDPLYDFLNEHIPAASSVNSAKKNTGTASAKHGNSDDIRAPLDMSYALRTVLATGRHFRSAIRLYMGFGLREEAVELALKVDPSLAREMARGSVELAERKRLWLMIAKNAASEASIGNGKEIVSKVVSVLRESGPDVLSIEDVLPFLPDFAQIDEIKDEICEALTSYSSKIESLLDEMKKADRSCERLRNEITHLRNRKLNVRSDARCALTNKRVLAVGEPFYVFPSGFVYLESAIKKHVMPHLNKRQRDRVLELEKILGGETSEQERYNLQTELDGLIAAECPLTGSIMVDLIDKGFEDEEEIGGNNSFNPANLDRVEV